MNQRRRADAPTNSGGAEALMFSLLHTAHAIEDRLERSLAQVDLSMAKLGVLNLLAEAGKPLALSELAARQNCVRSNMTQLVDRLEADGLVERVDDPNDRRSIRAALTPLGEERQVAGAERLREAQRDFVASLAAHDRPALERILSALQ